MKIIITTLLLLLCGCTEYETPQPQTAPTAKFTYSPTTIDTSTIVIFDASLSSDNETTDIQYKWHVNVDGKYSNISESRLVSYKFRTVGNHTVKLKVIDNIGWSDSCEETIIVN